MARKQFGEYYIGLDMGSTSVGWAVTDLSYNLLKLNGKAMWGVRLFEEAQTAEGRRIARIARRRIERRNQRLALLQELFEPALAQVDPGFLQRLSESALYPEDKTVKDRNSLFRDADYTDKQYHRAYPTIYHLRAELMDSAEPHDVRLVYLALHHILKYRGHFLFDGLSIAEIRDLNKPLTELAEAVRDELGLEFSADDTDAVQALLKDRALGIQRKQKPLCGLFGAATKPAKELVKALCGGKFKLSTIFEGLSIEEGDPDSICFADARYEEEIKPRLEAMLEDRFVIVDRLHAIYNWSVLADIIGEHGSLSHAKRAVYERHGAELALLKQVIRRHGTAEQYSDMFSRADGKKANYCMYVGHAMKGKRRLPIEKRCSREELCKELKKLLTGYPAEDPQVKQILEAIEAGTFLTKIVSTDNGVIPNQLHAYELGRILTNASGYLPFLSEKDDEGLTPADKIAQILSFRIPYYVGPLVKRNSTDNCWVERRSHEKVYPWSFDRIVDAEVSAERFITRMTAECTYLHGEKVLPKASVLYSEFEVLNELNNLCVQGEPITVEVKQRIYNELFLQERRVTVKKLIKWYEKRYGVKLEPADITGINGDFKSSLRPELDMRRLLGEHYTPEIAETLIRLKTLFGDDRALLLGKARKELPALPEALLQRATGITVNGWGRLSRRLLTGVIDERTGRSIIAALWETNENLMQLLSDRHSYTTMIACLNDDGEPTDPEYEGIRDLYVAPAVKRQIWQAVRIVNEIRRVTGHDPKKLFVEMARGEEERKEVKDSRRAALIACYKRCGDDTRDWVAELESREEAAYRRDRLYLYYTQRGRCMYTGEPIDLETLLTTNNVYDIDHIYPRSLVKDDSLDNRVLVRRTVNAEKRNALLDEGIRRAQSGFWRSLEKDGLISRKKLERLLRTVPFTEADKEGFIARQLVETRQSTKAATQVFRAALPDTEVVYSKAGNVSDFRRDHELLKVRGLNDLHHAKDAYLNIVVGNVFNTRFTHSPAMFARSGQSYNLRTLYEHPVDRGGVMAWQPGEAGTIRTVKHVMGKNNVLVTKQPLVRKGAIADLQPLKKGKGQLPLKKGMDSAKYGAYNKPAIAWFSIIACTEGEREARRIVPIPLHLALRLSDTETLLEYCREEHGMEEPRIILKCLRYQSLLEINGEPVRAAAKSGDYLVLCNARELILPKEQERYARAVLKYNERASEYAKTHGHAVLQPQERDGLSREGNLALFMLIAGKLSDVYTGFYGRVGREALGRASEFSALEVREQCIVIEQLIGMLSVSSRTLGDLTGIGMKANTGMLRASFNLMNAISFILVNQSITGLFEQRIDLLHAEPLQ